MRRFIFLAVVIAIMIAGGGLSAQLSQTDGTQKLPFSYVQTDNPEASVFVAANWQAQQFFLMVGFILVNMLGIGGTLAVIFWFLSRQIASVKNTPNANPKPTSAIESTEN